MPKTQNTVQDVLKWQRDTEDKLEKSRMDWKLHEDDIGPRNSLKLMADSKKFAELEEAHNQRDSDFNRMIAEVYKRSGSVANIRKTPLYIEIKTFYDEAWKSAKYAPKDLASEPEVRNALEKLATFILAPPIVDGFPEHLLPIPREWHQWVPPDLPSLRKFSPGRPYDSNEAQKRQTAFVNAARLRHFCDPLEEDITKRDGEGTGKSYADDFVVKLLNTLGISLK